MRLGALIFILLLVLILAAYYTGVTTDANSFANGAQKLVFAVTGRNSSGNFAAYPAGK